jgi:Gas vesicle synthesis protein GvpO
MAQRTRQQPGDDHDAEGLPPMSAREAADIARECITEMTGHEAVAMTSMEPTDDDGWVVEVEIVEERRIPSSADILGVYEFELDADGELLAFKRLRRYSRGQTGQSSNGRSNGGEP